MEGARVKGGEGSGQEVTAQTGTAELPCGGAAACTIWRPVLCWQALHTQQQLHTHSRMAWRTSLPRAKAGAAAASAGRAASADSAALRGGGREQR